MPQSPGLRGSHGENDSVMPLGRAVIVIPWTKFLHATGLAGASGTNPIRLAICKNNALTVLILANAIVVSIAQSLGKWVRFSPQSGE